MAQSRISCVTILLVGGMLLSCSTTTRPDASNPVTQLRDSSRSTKARLDSLEAAWAAGGPGTPDRRIARDAMRDIVWDYSAPTDLRLKIMGKLLDSTDPEEAAEARDRAKLMLPAERSRTMVALISEVAAARNWTDFIPALIRSYSHPVPEVKDTLRSERVALETLCAGKPVEQAVFELFVTPPAEEETKEAGQTTPAYAANPQERFRFDAWEVLGRLDADGHSRQKFVEDLASKAIPESDHVLLCLRACLSDLRCVPITGDELKWAMALRYPRHTDRATEYAAWWTETAAAVRQANPAATGALSLRYAEPIRWAAAHRPSWLTMSRDELKAQVVARMATREHNTRTNETAPVGRPYAEQVQTWDDRLAWGDFLAILVLDEAMQESALPAQMLRHAELDRRDEKTEYGGVVKVADAADAPASFKAILFPPRPGQRQGDTQFIASDDMIAASDFALAHYHFHAQSTGNRMFAGPSSQDLLYARKMGRSCLVLTTLSPDALGIDYYQPNGAVIDLGVMKRATTK